MSFDYTSSYEAVITDALRYKEKGMLNDKIVKSQIII